MKQRMDRRKMLGTLAITGLTMGLATSCSTADQNSKQPMAKNTDGTPRQFFPKNGPDPHPQENDIEKFPKCPYCGMNRRQWHHSRHLIHYSDNMVDPTCSLHCAAIGLSINIDRGPKAIYAADFGSSEQIKPLIDVDDANYLVGSKLPGTMTAQSKMAFADRQDAERIRRDKGGEIADFDSALAKGYLSMAGDTAMIRKRRAAKKKRMQQG